MLYQGDAVRANIHQLNLQMRFGLAFPFYSEAKITFKPTYKYDNGTDDYDTSLVTLGLPINRCIKLTVTSEKARIPAWCDRVLYRGEKLRQISYNTAPLRFSDHRPVYATFQCQVLVMDETLKEQVSRELYERRRSEVGNTRASGEVGGSDDDEINGYESIAPGLPPASTDRRKWWLDKGVLFF